MEATARAHPNIALAKYWGKSDLDANVPAQTSISATVDGFTTETTVRLRPDADSDRVWFQGELVETDGFGRRVRRFLNAFRDELPTPIPWVTVWTENGFPTSAGLASSASGFSALAVATNRVAGQPLSQESLCALARRASGSAARSMFGGFVELPAGSGTDADEAVAHQIAPREHWDIRCLTAVVSSRAKEPGSTQGMLHTQKTSPYYRAWRRKGVEHSSALRRAIRQRDWPTLREVAEHNSNMMHAAAIASSPSLLYWERPTVDLLQKVQLWRRQSLRALCTIDAGANPHVFCPAAQVDLVRQRMARVRGIERIIHSRVGRGARVVHTAAGA